MISGSRPTAPKARAGLLTPPGMVRLALEMFDAFVAGQFGHESATFLVGVFSVVGHKRL